MVSVGSDTENVDDNLFKGSDLYDGVVMKDTKSCDIDIIKSISDQTNAYLDGVSTSDGSLFVTISGAGAEKAKKQRIVDILNDASEVAGDKLADGMKLLSSKWARYDTTETDAFLKDYIVNRKYLFTTDNVKEDSDSEGDQDNDKDACPQSLVRKFSGGSRLKSRLRVEARCRRKQRKEDKKKVLSSKLSELKARRKKEVVEKLREISGQDAGDGSGPPNFLPQSCVVESCFGNDGTNNGVDAGNLSNRKIKRLERQERARLRSVSKMSQASASVPELDDEFHKLDFEDIIDDTPVRFNYNSVNPSSFGLSPEEILFSSDKELNKWCSMKHVIAFTDDAEGLALSNKYERRAKNKTIKRKILSSLYSSKRARPSSADGDKRRPLADSQQPKPNSFSNKTRIVKKYFKMAKPQFVDKLSINRLLAYDLQSDKKLKSYKNPTPTTTPTSGL